MTLERILTDGTEIGQTLADKINRAFEELEVLIQNNQGGNLPNDIMLKSTYDLQDNGKVDKAETASVAQMAIEAERAKYTPNKLDTSLSYKEGDIVTVNGSGYVADQDISPQPFNPSMWHPLTAGIASPTGGYDDTKVKADIQSAKADIARIDGTVSTQGTDIGNLRVDVDALKTSGGSGGGTATAYDDTAVKASIKTNADAIVLKADKTQVLTDVPTGALFTDTVYDDTVVKGDIKANADAIVLKADKSQVLTDVPANAAFTDTVYDDKGVKASIKTNSDAIALKADKTTTYTKTEVDDALLPKHDINKDYKKGSLVTYDDGHGYKIYVAESDIAKGQFNPSDWKETAAKGKDGKSFELKGSDTYRNIIAKTASQGDLWISTTSDTGHNITKGDGIVYDGANWLSVGKIQGPAGNNGTDGVSITVKSPVATKAKLTNGTQGDIRLVTDEGNFYFYNGKNWTDVGHVQGPQGPQGIDGVGITMLPPVADAAARLALSTAWTDNSHDGKSLVELDTGHLYVFDYLGADNAKNWVLAGQIKGPQGPQGVQGPKGEDGTSIHIKGTDTYDNIVAKDGKAGDLWIVSATTAKANAGDGLVSNGAGAGEANWTDIGEIKGEKGDKGDAGAAGPAGPKGDTGAKGDEGPTTVSSDANNIVELGTDGKLFAKIPPMVFEELADINFVNAAADDSLMYDGNEWINTPFKAYTKAESDLKYFPIDGSKPVTGSFNIDYGDNRKFTIGAHTMGYTYLWDDRSKQEIRFLENGGIELKSDDNVYVRDKNDVAWEVLTIQADVVWSKKGVAGTDTEKEERISNIVRLTKADYDAIPVKTADKVYLIVG